MYLIYIDADDAKIRENGMTPEIFWSTVEANLSDCGFELIEGTGKWFANWEENVTLGHVLAIQNSWVEDLPECVKSMTEYTVYQAGRIFAEEIDFNVAKSISELRKNKEFSDRNTGIKFQADYIVNILKAIEKNKTRGRAADKPVTFHPAV